MALSEMGVSDHTGGSGSVYRRAADSGFTEIEAAGRATVQNIWLTRMRSDNSGFHVGKGECPLCARNGHLMILKTMMSQPSFTDRSLATNDVIDYFCLNREALRIAS